MPATVTHIRINFQRIADKAGTPGGPGLLATLAQAIITSCTEEDGTVAWQVAWSRLVAGATVQGLGVFIPGSVGRAILREQARAAGLEEYLPAPEAAPVVECVLSEEELVTAQPLFSALAVSTHPTQVNMARLDGQVLVVSDVVRTDKMLVLAVEMSARLTDPALARSTGEHLESIRVKLQAIQVTTEGEASV